jgi:hypothetical protein
MVRLTCYQDYELKRREFADEDGIESHGDQCNSYSHECHLPSYNVRTRIDEYDQALDL